MGGEQGMASILDLPLTTRVSQGDKPMPQLTCSDADLIAMTLDGDIDAFGEIVRRYQDAVYATALHRTGNFADAQDVAQEAFLAAYQGLAKLREPARLAAWLRTVTLYTHNHWMRKRPEILHASEDAMERVAGDLSNQPDTIVEQRELKELVLEAVAALPNHVGEVVALYYIDGLSYQDIASYLSLPTTTVKGRLQMGRKQLKEDLMGTVEGTLRKNRPDDKFSESVLAELVERAQKANEQNNYEELLQACNEALEIIPHLEPNDSTKQMHLDIVKWQGTGLFQWEGELDQAASRWQEAAQLAGDLGKKQEQAQWLLMAAITKWQDGDYGSIQTHIDQAKPILQELGDRKSVALCHALTDLHDILPTDWQEVDDREEERRTGYAAYVFPLQVSHDALVWKWEAHPSTEGLWPTHHLVSTKLRRGNDVFGPHMAFGSLTQPAKMMPLQPELGQTWSGEINTYEGGEALSVETTVAGISDTTATPAGVFEHCLRLESQIDEQQHADMSDADLVFRRRGLAGKRILWFAPGVGLVKAYHEDKNGYCRTYLLTEYTTVTDSHDYLPLYQGCAWTYQSYREWCNLLVTERCAVADRDGESVYISSAAYSQALNAEGILEHVCRLHAFEEETGHPRLQAQTLNWLHNTHARQGNQEKATQYWEQQEAMCEQLGDAEFHYTLLMRTSEEHHPRQRVRACWEKAAQIARSMGDPRREARPWGWLSDAALRWEDYETAAEASERKVELLQAFDDGKQLAFEVAALDVARALARSDDAEQSQGTVRYVLYVEPEDGVPIIHAVGGISPLYGHARILPPSLGFLADTPLPAQPYRQGTSWTDHDRERRIQQEIVATTAIAKTPAGDYQDCLLVEADIRLRVERTGTDQGDAAKEAWRGFREGNLAIWYAREQGIVQMDFQHRNGHRTQIQLTKADIQESDGTCFPILPGNVWHYDWRNEKDELLIREMVRVLPKRGNRTYIAVSAYAVHPDYGR